VIKGVPGFPQIVSKCTVSYLTYVLKYLTVHVPYCTSLTPEYRDHYIMFWNPLSAQR